MASKKKTTEEPKPRNGVKDAEGGWRGWNDLSHLADAFHRHGQTDPGSLEAGKVLTTLAALYAAGNGAGMAKMADVGRRQCRALEAHRGTGAMMRVGERGDRVEGLALIAKGNLRVLARIARGDTNEERETRIGTMARQLGFNLSRHWPGAPSEEECATAIFGELWKTEENATARQQALDGIPTDPEAIVRLALRAVGARCQGGLAQLGLTEDQCSRSLFGKGKKRLRKNGTVEASGDRSKSGRRKAASRTS